MRRREFLLLPAAAGLARAQKDGDVFGAARDALCQALELLWERSTPRQIDAALTFIKRSLDQYSSYGDAHYYRALCMARLKPDDRGIGVSMGRARELSSEALRDRRDPFTLRAPQLDPSSLKRVGQKWALVVGISKFQPETGGRFLRFAAPDADAFSDLLVDPTVGRFPKDQVFRLLNQDATTASIKAHLNRIATNAKPEDVVLIYLSTHGSAREDDLRETNYLCTYDTDVTDRNLMFGTALPMVEVSSIVSTRCAALRTVLIFDTCHSGAAGEDKPWLGRSLSTAEFDRSRAGAGRYVLSSCGRDELAYEADGHGYFTASLIEGMQSQKGCARLENLFAQVQKDVAAKTGKQHPQMAKSDAAEDIVLGAAVGSEAGQCAG